MIMSYLKEDPSQVLLDAMLFSHDDENPSRAIEEQERRGAKKVKRFSMLPSKTNDGIPQIVKDTGITQEMRNSRDYNSMVKIQLENNKKWTRKSPFFNELPDGVNWRRKDNRQKRSIFDLEMKKTTLRGAFFVVLLTLQGEWYIIIP